MPTTDEIPTMPDTTTDGEVQHAEQTCDTCPHPWSAHDTISARYCVATRAGALTRGCVCPR